MKFIYGIIPVPVFYARDLGTFAGKSYGFFVRIRKDKADDRGLLEHELQHCRQFYRTLFLHSLLYLLSANYKYNSEIECYKLQLNYVADRERAIHLIVEFITTRYGLNVEASKVERDLRSARVSQLR